MSFAKWKQCRSPTFESEEQVTKEELQNQKQDTPEKEMFPTRDAGGANDVKVTWKSATGKAKRPSKDFFTPKDESGEPDIETEKVCPTMLCKTQSHGDPALFAVSDRLLHKRPPLLS